MKLNAKTSHNLSLFYLKTLKFDLFPLTSTDFFLNRDLGCPNGPLQVPTARYAWTFFLP